MRKYVLLSVGVVGITLLVILGLWVMGGPSGPSVDMPSGSGMVLARQAELLSCVPDANGYCDPYGSTAGGGAVTPSTDPSLSGTADPQGDAAYDVGNAVDGLSDGPVIFLAGMSGVLVLVLGVRYVMGFLR